MIVAYAAPVISVWLFYVAAAHSAAEWGYCSPR